jgi:hypothetical protein
VFRNRSGARAALLGAAAVLAVLFEGCSGDGGGGGGGGTAGADLIAASFLPPSVSTAPGPNGGVALPGAYLDQAVELKFDAVLDAGVLGGFFPAGGAAQLFQGGSPDGTSPVPYFAFADQTAARQSLQVRLNALGAPTASYVVGRHRDKPDTLVFDPFVPSLNPFGLPVSPGLDASQEYVLHIPVANALLFGGMPATTFGQDPSTLPRIVQGNLPPVSDVFRVTPVLSPNFVQPTVDAIEPLGGFTGTPLDPIPESGAILIRFSRRVRAQSLVPMANAIVRNTDVVNFSHPDGIDVAGSLTPFTPSLVDDSVYVFTPAAPYGPGPGGGEGYDIEVLVGTFGNPAIPQIVSITTGLPGIALPLANSLAAAFRTTPCTGCGLVASIGTTFNQTTKLDSSFIFTFGGLCRWNAPSALGLLTGRPIAGSPTGNTPASLGTRFQFIVDPQPPSTNPAGLFGPFDASAANSAGQCGPPGCNLGVNPNGGSHIMHLYEALELGNTEDSLEQIEWSPVSGVTQATTYPQYRAWCGLTNTQAPLSGGAFPGMFSVYDTNYNLTPYQMGIQLQMGCANPGAINPRKVPVGGPSNYVVPLATTQFVPFPVLAPCFDYATSAGASGAGVNLLIEQNIAPGNQLPNFNRYRATNFTPVRRLIGRPLEIVTPGLCPFNEGGTFDIYRQRFTFVGLVAQCRSLWFDTGTSDPTYTDFQVNPPIASQPPGTSSVWILEGTDVLNPGPGTTGLSVVYIDAAGVVNPAALAMLQSLRHFRFRVELRANNLTNQTPAYVSVSMAYTIP